MISVIIPAYNEEANITGCLESLNRQTMPRDQYELIVVDGNSRDRTRELAAPLADLVFIQTSEKVGGARNDGIMRARGTIVATTDADCVVPPDWLERIQADFERFRPVQLYGTVYPREGGIRNHLALALANAFSRLGYLTRTLYYTLGCNTAFDREAFLRAGMYRTIDAGDDLEIALRMKQQGRVVLDPALRVGFSMRRYQQFGTLRSLYRWLYIVYHGGESTKYQYSRQEYRQGRRGRMGAADPSAGKNVSPRVREQVEAFNGSPFARLLRLEITEVWPRGARVTMAPEGKGNPHGVIHGGAIFSLADQAFAIAANQEEVQVATSVYITFMTPATGRLEAVAEFLGETERTALYRVTVKEGDRLVASFEGVTFRK